MILSCANERTQHLEEVISTEIVMPIDSLVALRSYLPQDSYSYQYHIVAFYDSTECQSCLMRHFSEMNEKIQKYKSVYSSDYSVVIESSSNKLGQRRREYLMSQFENPVYIDTSGIFRRSNPFLFRDRRLYNFVTDINNKIIQIGNPLLSSNVEVIFMDKIHPHSSR